MKLERIMTTKELANYIKLNEKTVIKMAQEGVIPGAKIGSQWRFHLDSIDAYIQKDIFSANNKDLMEVINTGVNLVPLSRLISEELINPKMKSLTAEQVIKGLSDIAASAGLTSSRKVLFNELKNREKMLSTAVGGGVAIPHPRHPSSHMFKEPNIIFASTHKGIDFKAPDKKPVYVFFAVCAPNEFVHVRLMAKIARLMHMPDIVRRFKDAETKEAVIQILMEYDRHNFLSEK